MARPYGWAPIFHQDPSRLLDFGNMPRPNALAYSGGAGWFDLEIGNGGGVFHAAGIKAKHLAQLRIVGGQGLASFLVGGVFGPLQDVVQVDEQVGADHR